MTGVWFTFGPDGPALIESVAAFRDSGGRFVSLFDDASNPLPNEIIEAIRPDLRETTTWPRCGNLRGWPCVLGELDCMEKAAAKSGASEVLKIDSDTLVFDFDWIDRKAPMSGFVAGHGFHLYGMAYHLRLDALREVRASMLGRFRNENRELNEDRAISCEAFALYGPLIRAITWDKKLAGGWQFGTVPEEKYHGCAVVTFGNRKKIQVICSKEEKRLIVAREMAGFRSRRITRMRQTTS